MLYTTNLTTHIQTILLCTFLELWQNGLRGGEEHNCLCKTIRTKADAAKSVHLILMMTNGKTMNTNHL